MCCILYRVKNRRSINSRLVNNISALSDSSCRCSSASKSSCYPGYPGTCGGSVGLPLVMPSGLGISFKAAAHGWNSSRAWSMVHNAAHTRRPSTVDNTRSQQRADVWSLPNVTWLQCRIGKGMVLAVFHWNFQWQSYHRNGSATFEATCMQSTSRLRSISIRSSPTSMLLPKNSCVI